MDSEKVLFRYESYKRVNTQDLYIIQSFRKIWRGVQSNLSYRKAWVL